MDEIDEKKIDNIEKDIDNFYDAFDNYFDNYSNDIKDLYTQEESNNYQSLILNTEVLKVINEIINLDKDIKILKNDINKDSNINTIAKLNIFNEKLKDIINDLETYIRILKAPIKESYIEYINNETNLLEESINDITERLLNRISEDLESEFQKILNEINSSINNIYVKIKNLKYGDKLIENDIFSDIGNFYIFRNYILKLSKNNIIKGFGDGTFRPNNQVTRAEFLKMAIKSANIEIENNYSINNYIDVNPNHNLISYINYSSNTGLLFPISQYHFLPDKPINRIDAVLVLLKLKRIPINLYTSSVFSDLGNYHEISIIETARNHKIISGYSDGTFKPYTTLSRGEASK
jgi:hypothetical protein